MSAIELQLLCHFGSQVVGNQADIMEERETFIFAAVVSISIEAQKDMTCDKRDFLVQVNVANRIDMSDRLTR